MRLIGSLLFFWWPHARIWNLERRSNRQYFSQGAVLLCCQNDAPHTWIYRHTAQRPSDLSQFLSVVDGTKFHQRLDAFADRLGTRRIQKREFGKRSQFQCLGLQNNRCEIRAPNLRSRKSISRIKVICRVKPHTNPRADPATTTRTLIRAGLADRFDRKPLEFAAGTVPTDSRGA